MDKTKINEIIEQWGSKRNLVIEMLSDIQNEFNYIPPEAVSIISEKTGVPVTQLYQIGTFYNVFSFTPKGKHHISICMGTSCHVMGAPRIATAITREIGISPGEVSKDMQYSMEEVRCLGCCGMAPIVTIGNDLYGKLTPAKIRKILDKYRKENI